MAREIPQDEYHKLKIGDSETVFVCNNCGSCGSSKKEVEHYPPCKAGEAKKWTKEPEFKQYILGYKQ